MSDPLPPLFDDSDTDPNASPPQHIPDQDAALMDERMLGAKPNTRSHSTAAADPEQAKPRGPRAWGGLLVLAIYLVGASSAIFLSYRGSKEFKIADTLEHANAMVGDDDGKEVDSKVLIEAAKLYLQALLLDPDLLAAHNKLKSIKWRLQERRETFPPQMERQHSMLAERSKLGKQRKGLFAPMAIDAEERFSLSSLRKKLYLHLFWMGLGGLVLAGWSVVSYFRQKAEHAARLRRAAELNADRGSALY